MNTKTCFKCGVEKPLSEYYAHKMMADGHLNKCKTCAKKDSNKHRDDNLESVREYDRARNKTKNRAKKNVEKTKRLRARPHVLAAHNAVRRAVLCGKLIRPSKCERCERVDNINAHHDDHSKHMDVMWLCPTCHALRHKEIGRIPERSA